MSDGDYYGQQPPQRPQQGYSEYTQYPSYSPSPGQPSPGQPSPGQPNPAGGPPPPSRNVTLTVVLAIIAGCLVVVVAAVGWLAWQQRRDTDTTAQDKTITISAPPAKTSTRPAPTSARPTTSASGTASLPSTATLCGDIYGRTGNLRGSATGNSITSCPFAEEVRRAYAASGPLSSQPRDVAAVSPVTGQSYTMSCSAGQSYVQCSGGNDALVYLY